jgi:hypothetical protein
VIYSRPDDPPLGQFEIPKPELVAWILFCLNAVESDPSLESWLEINPVSYLDALHRYNYTDSHVRTLDLFFTIIT